MSLGWEKLGRDKVGLAREKKWNKNEDPAVRSWENPIFADCCFCKVLSQQPGSARIVTLEHQQLLGCFLNVLLFCHTSTADITFPKPQSCFPAQTCFWFCSDSLPVLILLCCVIGGLSLLKSKENAEGRCCRTQEVQGSSSQLPPGRSEQFRGFGPSLPSAGQAMVGLQTPMALQHPSPCPKPSGSPSPGCLIAMQHLSLLCCPISH